MRTLVALVGVQGSGKTTTIRAMGPPVTVLRSSTTRDRRSGEGDDYHFEKAWNEDFAWTIQRDSEKYGMRVSELDRITRLGITLFAPEKVDYLREAAAKHNFEVVTIGLDTVKTLEEQKRRVAHDTARLAVNQEDFNSQLKA